jgi:hypothetical protein
MNTPLLLLLLLLLLPFHLARLSSALCLLLLIVLSYPCVLWVISYKEDTVLVPWQFWHMSNFHFARDILSWKEPCEAPPRKDSKNTCHIIIILEFWCHSIEIFILVQQNVRAKVCIEQFSCIHFLSMYLGSTLLGTVIGHQIFLSLLMFSYGFQWFIIIYVNVKFNLNQY